MKYWSVGNEMGSDHMEGPDDAVSYPKAVFPIIKALKKADPSLWLCMSGDWSKKEWFTKSFAKLAPFVDTFAVHNYFSLPFNLMGPKTKFEYEYEANSEPSRAVKDAWAVRKLMDKYFQRASRWRYLTTSGMPGPAGTESHLSSMAFLPRD